MTVAKGKLCRLVASVASVSMLALPAQAEIFSKQPKPFVAADRMFAVRVPPSWTIRQPENRNEVQFYPDGRGHPMLSVRRLDVPDGADPIQLALLAIDERLSKMPFFNLAGKKRVKVAGLPAATVTGTYAHQGNLQYPRTVEEVYVVVGKEAFVLHFECFRDLAPSYASALSRFYKTFVPRPKREPSKPAKTKFPRVDTMPY